MKECSQMMKCLILLLCNIDKCIAHKISGVKMAYHYRFAHGWFPEMPLEMAYRVEVG